MKNGVVVKRQGRLIKKPACAVCRGHFEPEYQVGRLKPVSCALKPLGRAHYAGKF